MTLSLVVELLILAAVVVTLVTVLRGGPGGESGRIRELERQVGQLQQTVAASGQLQGQRIVELQQVLDGRIASFTAQSAQESRLRGEADSQARQEMNRVLTQNLVAIGENMTELKDALSSGVERLRSSNGVDLERIRVEVGEKLQETLHRSTKEMSTRVDALTLSTEKRQEDLRRTLSAEMEKVRDHNESQLEKMRQTVDEKLQGTLEKRLGESFQLVSDRLEQVQKGLGEMRNLATDVGGLKRVLTNVKSRGTWGEVQLARQLEDQLTSDQYEENVAISPGAAERVEFAVKLPGRDSERPVFLPIDSKFPQEPYERLLSAQESGLTEGVSVATKELEVALRQQAKTISSKYVKPPFSTDFAIMYLPTEGLFAEALRIPGLASRLQSEHRVMVTGPTTLMSLLGSLQMGFKTLAIEQRSSEVWQVLGAAKMEFTKYGHVWEKLGKQLRTAQNTVEEAGKRTRAVERKLRDVEVLDYNPETVTGAHLLGID